MTQRLRAKVWWPKIDKDVEKYVNFRPSLVEQSEKPEPIASTEFPECPWKAVGIDILGPLLTGESIFVCVDYYSRYYEADVMNKTTNRTIRPLAINICKTLITRSNC